MTYRGTEVTSSMRNELRRSSVSAEIVTVSILLSMLSNVVARLHRSDSGMRALNIYYKGSTPTVFLI